MYLSSKFDEGIFLPKESPELQKCNLESDVCKAGQPIASWLDGWCRFWQLSVIVMIPFFFSKMLFIMVMLLRSLMKNMMLVMVAVKTIKVVRAGSFKYWAQGYTLRSRLAVT